MEWGLNNEHDRIYVTERSQIEMLDFVEDLRLDVVLH